MIINYYSSLHDLVEERKAVSDFVSQLNILTKNQPGITINICPDENDYYTLIAGALPERAGDIKIDKSDDLSIFMFGSDIWESIVKMLDQAVKRQKKDPNYRVMVIVRDGSGNCDRFAEYAKKAAFITWKNFDEIKLALILMLRNMYPDSPLSGFKEEEGKAWLCGIPVFSFIDLPGIAEDRKYRDALKKVSDSYGRWDHHRIWAYGSVSDEKLEEMKHDYENDEKQFLKLRDKLIKKLISDTEKALHISAKKKGGAK